MADLYKKQDVRTTLNFHLWFWLLNILFTSSEAKKSVNMQNRSISHEQKGRKVSSIFSFPQKAYLQWRNL